MPEGGNVAVIGSSVVEIEAGIDRVWAILTDFPAYGEWNPLCRGISVDGPVGGAVRMEVQDDLKGSIVTLDYRLDAFDVGRRIAWSADFPDMGLSARRDQYLQPLDAGRCVYWTTDLYTGPNARELAAANGTWVRSAFDGMALALKVRSGDGGISSSDVAAIQQLMLTYGQALDDGESALLDDCFVKGGIMRMAERSLSIPEYRTLCDTATRVLTAMHHHIGPSRLRRDLSAPNRLRARTNFTATHVHPDRADSPVTVGGVYRDILERRPEGWRIVERNGDAAWITGDIGLLDFSAEAA